MSHLVFSKMHIPHPQDRLFLKNNTSVVTVVANLLVPVTHGKDDDDSSEGSVLDPY
jgi:hypothetical protein